MRLELECIWWRVWCLFSATLWWLLTLFAGFDRDCCQKGSNLGWWGLKINMPYDLKKAKFSSLPFGFGGTKSVCFFYMLFVFNGTDMLLSGGDIQTMQTERLHSCEADLEFMISCHTHTHSVYLKVCQSFWQHGVTVRLTCSQDSRIGLQIEKIST